MTADDREAIDRLDAYLDALAAGPPVLIPAVDPEWTAVDRQFRSLDRAPSPPPAFAARLLEDLMHADVMPRSINPRSLPMANGRARHRWQEAPDLLPPSSRHRAWSHLATAAFVVLTLVGSLLAVSRMGGASIFGLHPGWPGQQPHDAAVLPALSATPATPEVGAAPIAEFLWQANGGPDVPLTEVGRPGLDPEGNLWVPDATLGQFLIFAPDGTFLEAWGTPGSGDAEFNFSCSDTPYGGAVFDATGAFYVADSGNHRIQKFGPDRAYMTAWGSQGIADDQFNCPAGLAIDGQGRILVSDRNASTVKVFDAAGAWLASWTGISAPIGIAVDGDDNIWVAAYGAGSVVKLSPDGDRLETWGPSSAGGFVDPVAIAVDREGRVFVVELSANRVQVFAPDMTPLGDWGELGNDPGQFRQARGITLDGQGGVYVTEWAGQRVQKFQLLPPFGP